MFQNFFSTVLQYRELEKMEFSGAIGYTFSLKVIDIFEKFTNLINLIYEGNYNPLDMSENIFLEQYVRFTDQIADMDKQLANIFSKAFGNCYNMDSFFKVQDVNVSTDTKILKKFSLLFYNSS